MKTMTKEEFNKKRLVNPLYKRTILLPFGATTPLDGVVHEADCIGYVLADDTIQIMKDRHSDEYMPKRDTNDLVRRLNEEIARIVRENAKNISAPPYVTRETRALLEECLTTIEAYEAVRRELAIGLHALSTALAKPLRVK